MKSYNVEKRTSSDSSRHHLRRSIRGSDTPKNISSSSSPLFSKMPLTRQKRSRLFLGVPSSSPSLSVDDAPIQAKTRDTRAARSVATTTRTEVEFRSVLRIRPLTAHERNDATEDDSILTTKSDCEDNVVQLSHRPKQTQQRRQRQKLHTSSANPTATGNTDGAFMTPVQPLEYHFDSILQPRATQSQVYKGVGGLSIARDAVSPLLMASPSTSLSHDDEKRKDEIQLNNHVLISMGISNSGKTYTIFGNAVSPSDSVPVSTNHGNSQNCRIHVDVNETDNNNVGEGIVPRIIDDLFFAQKDRKLRSMLLDTPSFNRDVKFCIQLSMVHVHNDHVYDMLSSLRCTNDDGALQYSKRSALNRGTKSSSKRAAMTPSSSSIVQQMAVAYENKTNTVYGTSSPKFPSNDSNTKSSDCNRNTMEELRISQDPRTSNFCISPTVITCHDAKHARQVLSEGLGRNTTSSTGTNYFSSRGHTMITLWPVLVSSPLSSSVKKKDHSNPIRSDLARGNDDDSHQDDNCNEPTIVSGGSVTIIDTAGIERTKRSRVSGIAMRESVAINSSMSALLHCLRIVKQNSVNGDSAIKSTSTTRPRPFSGSNSTSKCHSQQDVNQEKFVEEEDEDGKSYDDDCENTSPNIAVPAPSLSSKGHTGCGKVTRTQIVPYRQSKLTMLLQPLFSGNNNIICNSIDNNTKVEKHQEEDGDKGDSKHISMINKTTVTLLVSAYPGGADYNEKKSLLSEIDALRGLSVIRSTVQKIPIGEDKTHLTDKGLNGFCNNVLCADVSNADKEQKKIHVDENKLPFQEDIVSPRKKSFASAIRDGAEEKKRSSKKNSPRKRSPLKSISAIITSSSSSSSSSSKNRKCAECGKVKKEQAKLMERLNTLEKRNNVLETKCQNLTLDNANLRKLLKETTKRENEAREEIKRGLKRKEMEEGGEENRCEFQRARESWRRQHWDLLSSPLREHMKKVEETMLLSSGSVGRRGGNGFNGCFQKPPFPLFKPEDKKKLKSDDDNNIFATIDFVKIIENSSDCNEKHDEERSSKCS